MDSDNDYQLSDSEEEYTKKEKQLLNKVRNRTKNDSESENEVFGVGATDSDESGSDVAASDINDDNGDDLPNQRAWGKDKRQYYKTDYVDADYGGFQGKDAVLAEQEEEEALALQKQLAQQLDDDDFAFDLLTKKSEVIENNAEEIVKTDISKLSTRQKLHLLEKESPEFMSLVEDYQAKMAIAREYLYPVMQKYRTGQIPNCKAMDFVQTHYQLILNYCTNIYMYLLLKASKKCSKPSYHQKLFQYRQLLLQLEEVFNDVMKVQIELMLKDNNEATVCQNSTDKKKLKLLAMLSKQDEKTSKKSKKHVKFVDEEKPAKKAKLEVASVADPMDVDDGSTSSEDDVEEKTMETEETDVEKRAITYAMAKNKGLTPHRKKEQRNPRVKHKLKYRKAMIRRKGAVREPRKELTRYAGEISGIKATVSKSIKIKT